MLFTIACNIVEVCSNQQYSMAKKKKNMDSKMIQLGKKATLLQVFGMEIFAVDNDMSIGFAQA